MTDANIAEIEKDLKPILTSKMVSIEQEHVGKTYGKLFVMRISGRHPKRKTVMALCRCECGTVKLIAIPDAKRLHTKSCGCISKFAAPKHGEANSTNRNATKEYAAWSLTRLKVFRVMRKDIASYVGYKFTEGELICDRWMDIDKGYLNFLEDMGRSPEKGRLTKHDKSKRYDKENCYWRVTK